MLRADGFGLKRTLVVEYHHVCVSISIAKSSLVHHCMVLEVHAPDVGRQCHEESAFLVSKVCGQVRYKEPVSPVSAN